jgi:hypothetical protein
VELRNSFWKIADSFRIFCPEALYRRRGIIRGNQGLLTPGRHGQGLGRAPYVWEWPLAPLRLSFGLREASRKNKTSRTCFIQFQEYFLCSFSETQKTAENRKLALWHLVNRLVPEIA